MTTSTTEILSGLEPSSAALMARQLHRVKFSRRQSIYHQGDQADRMYIIASGKVKLSRQTRDGRENVLAVLGPSDIFGELALLEQGNRTSNATAITDVWAESLDREDLRKWLAGPHEIAEHLLKLLSKRLRLSNDSLSELTYVDVPGRVARALLRLAHRFGEVDSDGLRVTHDLTQEEIAQLVGASREAVNRTLADFAGRGWIVTDGKSILIRHPRRLARRAR
jgi:CRP/FNR family transcriptional regulator, cyclic AMP receptor protein